MSDAPLGVVMVSASFHPVVGGAERQALELSSALRARGHAVIVATRRLETLSAYEEVRGVPVHRLWKAGRGGGVLDACTFMASLAWFLLARRGEYGVIHVHLAGSPALAACVMGRLLRKRVFVKLGGGVGIGELAASAKTLPGRLKLRALAVLKPQFIAVVKGLAAEAARYLGAGVGVHVLPNGVDTARYKPASPAARAAARLKLGWPAKALVFLYAGRLSYEKRLPGFVEAWTDSVRKSRTDALFALVGEGAELPAIESAIRYSRMADRVKVHAPRADLEEVYAAADVFVLPSISEGLSNALLEAMASGLAVLASRVGGTPEAVEDGRSGLLFTAENEPEMRAQLGKLLERPELALVMGAAARRAAEERFSLPALAEKYELIYRYGT